MIRKEVTGASFECAVTQASLSPEKERAEEARQFLPPWREERTRTAYQDWRG